MSVVYECANLYFIYSVLKFKIISMKNKNDKRKLTLQS